MTTMVSEVYDALTSIDGGCAHQVESSFAKLEDKMNGGFQLLQWMLGFALAMTIALLFLALRH